MKCDTWRGEGQLGEAESAFFLNFRRKGLRLAESLFICVKRARGKAVLVGKMRRRAKIM